jgi:hypothetical protein
MTMSRTLIRVDTPQAVQLIAEANHASYSRTTHAASVTLTGGLVYWWAA